MCLLSTANIEECKPKLFTLNFRTHIFFIQEMLHRFSNWNLLDWIKISLFNSQSRILLIQGGAKIMICPMMYFHLIFRVILRKYNTSYLILIINVHMYVICPNWLRFNFNKFNLILWVQINTHHYVSTLERWPYENVP